MSALRRLLAGILVAIGWAARVTRRDVPDGSVVAVPAAPVTARQPVMDLAVARRIRGTVLTVAAAIAMVETDRLIQGVTVQGRSGSLGQVEGPLVLASDTTQIWRTWQEATASPIVGLLIAHAVFDLLFLCGYASLLRAVVGHGGIPRPAASRMLELLVAAELIECAGVIAGAVTLAAGLAVDPWATGMIAGVTTLKWLALGLLLLLLLRDPDKVESSVRPWLAGIVARAGRALFVQRLSMIVVVALAVLGLLPTGEVLDQLPDVQRAWVDGLSEGTTDAWHPIWALVAALLVAIAVFVVGRQRTQLAWMREYGGKVPTVGPRLRWWLIGPAVVLAAAVLLWWFGLGEQVDPLRVGIYVGIPVLAVAAHLVLCRRDRRRTFRPGEARRADDVLRAGDVLGLAVLLVAGLGLVRSMVAPLLLAFLDGTAEWPRTFWQAVLFGVGVAILVDAPRRAVRLISRIDGSRSSTVWTLLLRPDSTSAEAAGPRRAAALAFGGIAMAVLLVLLLAPQRVTGGLGVVATTLAVLGAETVILAFLVVGLQWRRPLALFELLRLEATPVLSLTAALLLFTSLAGGSPQLHALRVDPGPAPAAPIGQRPDLRALVGTWIMQMETRNCARPAGGTRAVPLVLVAASGGGVRAMAWTARSMTAVGRTPCGAAATLVSSGVSGGSVGLAVTRAGPGPSTSPDAIEAEVLRLSRPDGLAVAAAAMFDGDIVSAMTGIRLPALLDGSVEWADRAGLIERVWEQDAGPLAEPFGSDRRGPAGALILNSTASTLGCRVLVSQVDLAGTSLAAATPITVDPGRKLPQCQRDTGGLPSSSFDLVQSYAGCLGQMTWATAAMLSARFPFVTPAARLRCDEKQQLEELQLIDGGYAEGSGIATIADIAPDVMELVREHNAAQGPGGFMIVPYLLYLEDETRTDLETDPPGLTTELFVPLVGLRAAAQLRTSGAWTQRVAQAIADPCPPGPTEAACRSAVGSMRAAVPGGIVVAAPLTTAAITAPLGWTLSSDSLRQLQPDLGTGCGGRRVQGYASLCTLLPLLDR